MDIEKLLYTILSAAVPGALVAPSADTETVGKLPAVLYAATSGGRVPNGARGLGESWTVAVSVLAGSMGAAKTTGRAVSDALHSAWESGAAVPGSGSVSYLDETSLFRRAPQTETNAQNVHQANAVFALVIRPA